MTMYPRQAKIILALLSLVTLLAAAPLTSAMPPGQGSGPVVIVNIAYLHQRTGPGPEYVVQGIHAGGAMLPVIGRTADRSWWQVQTQFGAGWVINDHVLTRGDFRGVPVVTEFGILDRPKAIVVGMPIPVYTLPNPGSISLGLAPSEAQFPIVGRAYHSGTETWYWLVETEVGPGWLGGDVTAVYGVASDIHTYTQEEARELERGTIASDGVVSPPPPVAIPPVPVAPAAAAVPAVETTAPAAPAPAAPAPAPLPAAAPQPAPILPPPPEVYRMNVAGDCYALSLVSFLIQLSPVTATRLDCSSTAAGRDSVILGQADVGIAINGDCGVLAEIPVATLVTEDGSTDELSFCVAAAPSSTVRALLNWIHSDQGAAAIRLYRGLPGTHIPTSAIPFGE